VIELFDKKIINHKSSLFITFAVIVFCGFFLTDGSILNSAVLLITTSFLFSILALFKEEAHRLRNRLICIFGVFGAILMILFSAYSLVSSL